MSAFIVSAAQINMIISAAVAHGSGRGISYRHKGVVTTITAENAAETAALLYTENVRSVNYRYNERTRFNGYSYENTSAARSVSAIEVIKLVSSLEYQSSEHAAWVKSEAHSITTAITASKIGDVAGYSAAAWTI